MYALVTQGGGRMLELQHECAMPLGEALARFELHWDDPDKDETWCRTLTDSVARIIRSSEDVRPGRPYRGDVWLDGPGRDPEMDAVLRKYNRRPI